MKNNILLAIAVVAGILAFILTKINLEKQYKRLGLQAQKVLILSPKRNLLAGDVITRDALAVRRIFSSATSQQQIKRTDLDLIVGQRLANDVSRGDFLLWRDIDMPGGGTGHGGLAHRIKMQERALSLSVDSVSSVSGLVRPNDHVDILGTFRFPASQGDSRLDTVTLTLLQNVTILAVGRQLGGASAGGRRSGGNYATITVNVSPEEAELLVFAQQKGEITLTLRNPRDVYVVRNPRNINFTSLQQQLGDLTKKREKRLRDE